MELTDDKIVAAAAEAPKIFMDASLGEGGQYSREPGIQLTKEQILSLRKYEVLGLSLPVRLADVIVYLNYGAGDAGRPGLTPADFQRTFSMTYDHAKRWSPLRERIMMTGTDLKIFAGSIIGMGNGIIEVYDDLKASRYLEEHDIKTPEAYQQLKIDFPDLPGLELESADKADIKYYLEDILGKVRACHVKAEAVRKELDSFGKDMREKVYPEIQLRLKSVRGNTYQEEVKAVQERIDQRADELDVLNKQYDQLVQDAIAAAATLNIGGLILGIYQGVKAEQVRSARKKLREEQEVDINLMASKNQTLSSLNRVRGDLQNLDYVAVEAKVATENLMLVWDALSGYLGDSVKEVNALNNALSLRTFMNKVKGVVGPWEKIQVSSDELLKVFRLAEEEYAAQRGARQ